ncbi:MAG: hypothetical protein K8T89_24650, partial [Planctomycetes bacterium]|nr:hypothetical protein [Planctomycetota bacterium]
PTDFTARKGEPQILLTLKRVKATDKNSDPQPKEMPPVATRDEELRKTLPGTWGHKNEDWLTMFTLNSDGTFSSRRSYTKKFGKLFNEDVTSSGNWKLAEGVVICTVTASTDKDSRNQVFSYRIRSITATELIAVDQFGQLRREWKTR